VVVQANEGCAVIFRTFSIDDHKALHNRKICRACVEIYSDFDEEYPFRENPSLIGLYFYQPPPLPTNATVHTADTGELQKSRNLKKD